MAHEISLVGLTRLADQDVDWSAGVLTIRHAKHGHTRLIPVQSSTLEALQQYRTFRDQALGSRVAPAFFVTVGGQPCGSDTVLKGTCAPSSGPG